MCLDLTSINENKGEEIEEKIFSEKNGKTKDNLICSTFHTAILHDLPNKLSGVDIILIDEAHNVAEDSNYNNLIDDLVKKGKNGSSPLIIPVTATPSNITKKVFGEPIFTFGLEKYLMSKYSPNVDYKIITNSNTSISDVNLLKLMIEDAKKQEGISEKKELLKEIINKFEEMMASFSGNEELVDDLINRVSENGNFEETIIFCNGIDESDKIAEIINNKTKKTGYALSYHSKNDKNKAIEKLSDKNDPCNIVISIGKLNESIDLPVVKNVVFWRWTEVEKIFFKQFGRGLRGTGTVKYFDYIGGLRNFVFIGNIYEKYKQIQINNEKNNNGEDEEKTKKFTLTGGTLGSLEHSLDLFDIGLGIIKLKENIENIKLATKEQLQELYKNKELEIDYFVNRKIKKYASEWNLRNSEQKGFTLPSSVEGIIGQLGGDKKISLSKDYVVSLLEGKEFEKIKLATKE